MTSIKYTLLANNSNDSIDNNNLNIAIDKNSDIGQNVEIKDPIETYVPKKNKRVYWVDFLRIFSSFLVVYLHCSAVNIKRGKVGSHNWNGLFLHNSTTRHCVPMFVMISGIFFLNPDKKITLKKLYTKNIFRMVKCLIFWSLYYEIFDKYVVNVLNKQYKYDKNLVKTIVHDVILAHGHLWYLYFVIGLYMVTPIYRAVTKERETAWYMVAICMFLSQFIPTLRKVCRIFYKFQITIVLDFIKKLQLEVVGSYTVYYLLGYLLYTHEFSKKAYIYIWYAIGFISFIGTIVLRFAENFIMKKEVFEFGKYDCFNVSLIAISTFIFFKYTVSKWTEPLMRNEKFKNFVLTLSECSFGVYLIHMAIYNTLHRFKFGPLLFDPYYWCLIYTIIIYSLSFLSVYLLRKISLFRSVT